MQRAIKVLMLVENAPVPEDNRVWPEALALREQGYQVSVICPQEAPHSTEPYLCLEGIHIYRYRVPAIKHKVLAYFIEYIFSLSIMCWLSLRVWRRHGFDVLHVANPPDIFFPLGLFYGLFGKKFIFDQHDPTPEVFQVKYNGRLKMIQRVLLLLERCTYRCSHLVLVTNESLKRLAIERGHVPSEKIFVVRNGPGLLHTEAVPYEPALKGGRKSLLAYMGVMAEQDGVEFALYAMDILVHKRKRCDASFVLMGDGPTAGKLRQLAQELQLEDYVHFTGWLNSDDLLRYLTAADIGLTPDPQNGLNEYCSMVKTVTYMSLGKPVVAFDLLETRISAQSAALYATPNEVEDFANKIEILLDNADMRARMGTIGKQRVAEALSWEQQKKLFLQAYDALGEVTSPI